MLSQGVGGSTVGEAGLRQGMGHGGRGRMRSFSKYLVVPERAARHTTWSEFVVPPAGRKYWSFDSPLGVGPNVTGSLGWWVAGEPRGVSEAFGLPALAPKPRGDQEGPKVRGPGRHQLPPGNHRR